ncbi:DUF1996 domain-containing protein [Nonomuraea sp. NPDC049714]|uniref:DUF1996 domain-containing protein n=1 Tax=Nonomuraea sp. NPDC049714 TaxID=3364357 RepID=UPI00379BA311
MRSRRMAAAMSALAMVAGGLVSAAVIGSATPALADHCEVAEQAPPQNQQQDQDQPQDQNQDQNQQDQGQNNDQNNDQQDQNQRQPEQNQDQDQQQDQNDQQNDNQNQDQNQDQNQNDPNQNQQDQNQQDQNGQNQQQDTDGQTGPSGGGVAADPIQQPEDQENGVQSQDRQRDGAQDPDGNDVQDQNRRGDFRDRDQNGSQDRRGNRPRPTQQPTGTPSPSASPSPSPSPTGGEENECADLGPFVTDFVNIRQIPPNQNGARIGRSGSRGSFVSACGTNGNGHNNPDNFIVAPGVRNGAHHLHDYVGNLSADAFSTDESLAAAGTTCRRGDQSTYFWPVLRNRQVDANTEDPDGNVGQVLRPRSVTLQFRGNATSRVVAMPRFLRIIMGDAKAATNGTANARAGWSCTGFTNRVSPDKYPLCPRGSQVARILDFPSCWDGQNTDSANHRSHIVFPDQNGACPQGTRAVPQLHMVLTYSVPPGPSFAVDAFPEQLHNPVTDHADFVNVMPESLMNFAVNCINRGRRC